MDFFTKLDMYIDYNNSYSLNRALTTLKHEFDLAVSKKNTTHAKVVIDTARRLHDKLSKTYRESEDRGETMSYFQKTFAKTLRSFMAYLIQQMKSEFGGSSTYEQEIEQTINQ